MESIGFVWRNILNSIDLVQSLKERAERVIPSPAQA